ncbi:MAG TPA: hypothetical protein VH332_03135 [Nitrospira sp.]|jgi:DNA-binding NtrC family response regulator
MNGEVSPVRASILIADRDVPSLEPLIHTLGDRRLDLHYELCSSHNSARIKLLRSSYQLIISDAHLAEIDDFYLFRHIQALPWFVPLVVTANASKKESARRLLSQGAFDLITSPPEHEQTVNTIRMALWHGTLMALINSQDKMLEKYRQHLATYPGDKRKHEAYNNALSLVQQTLSFAERTMQHLERSLRCLTDLATDVSQRAQEQAFKRLETLGK